MESSTKLDISSSLPDTSIDTSSSTSIDLPQSNAEKKSRHRKSWSISSAERKLKREKKEEKKDKKNKLEPSSSKEPPLEQFISTVEDLNLRDASSESSSTTSHSKPTSSLTTDITPPPLDSNADSINGKHELSQDDALLKKQAEIKKTIITINPQLFQVNFKNFRDSSESEEDNTPYSSPFVQPRSNLRYEASLDDISSKIPSSTGSLETSNLSKNTESQDASKSGPKKKTQPADFEDELRDEEMEQLRLKYKERKLSAREEQQLIKKPFVIVKTSERLRSEKEAEKAKKRKDKETEKKHKAYLAALKKKTEDEERRKIS